MNIFFKRLSTRLYLVVSLCFTAAMLMVIFVSVQVHERSLIEKAEVNLLQVATVFQANLDIILDTRREALHNMAENLQRWTSNEHPSLADDAALRELFDHIWVVNRSGRVVDEWPRLGAVREGLTIEHTDMFAQVRDGQPFYLTRPQLSYYNNEHVVHATVPMYTLDGDFLGAVVGILSLRNNEVLNRIVTTRIGGYGYVAISDRGGYIVGHPDRTFLGRQLVASQSPYLKKALEEGWQGITRSSNVYGDEILQAIVPLQSGHWVVGVQISLDEALQPARVVRNVQWILGGVAMVVTLTILSLIMRSYLRPIVRLKQEVSAVYKGRLKRLSEPRMYELKQLVYRFNNLLEKNASTAESLRQRQAYLDQILATSAAGLFMADKQGQIQYVNERMVQMTGYAAHDLIKNGFSKQLSEADRTRFVTQVNHAIAQQSSTKTEFQLHHNDGRLIWLRVETSPVMLEDECVGHVGTVTDISTQRAKLEELHHAASQDVLTGVLNRRGIEAELELVFLQSQRENFPLIVLMIDLDNFKRVNDTHGHAYGDRVLAEIARLMRNFTRDTDKLGRLGGDEFVIALPNCPMHRAQQLADGLIRGVLKQAEMDTSKQHVSLSIGICQRISSDETYVDLLARADSAAYAAKDAGGNQWILGNGVTG